MKLFDTRVPPTAARLADFERTLPAALPDDYRAFLRVHNGGRPEPSGFAIPGLGDRSGIARFLALDGAPWDDLEAHLRMYSGRIPRGWLPVAYDDCGNLLLMPLAGPARGRLFFWDHEAEGDGTAAPTWEVAESFARLLERLT
jgi:cell wall assembly regulator SMI1